MCPYKCFMNPLWRSFIWLLSTHCHWLLNFPPFYRHFSFSECSLLETRISSIIGGWHERGHGYKQLLWVQDKHGMCSLFVNSDTYTFYSVVFFFKYNQSIYYLRLQNKKKSYSFYIPNSCVHFVHNKLTSSQESNINTVCVLSLSILVPTHFTL